MRRQPAKRRRTLSRLAAVLLLLAATACAQDTRCVSACEKARPELLEQLGFEPEQVDCSADKWAAAKSCAACRQIFRDDYGVEPGLDCGDE